MSQRVAVAETERDETWGSTTWRATVDGDEAGSVTAWIRPDGRCFVSFSRCKPEARQPLLDAVGAAGAAELRVTAPDDPAALALYRSFGFERDRRETGYIIPTELAVVRLSGAVLPDGVRLLSPSDADLVRLRRLDNQLRDDVPGTHGWKWTAAAFKDETFGPQYDPELYAVAVRDADYIGLARVWKGSSARLGMIGVVRQERRRGLSRALLAQVFNVLASRGVEAVSTEVDDTNVASVRLITGLGGRPAGASLELVKVIR